MSSNGRIAKDQEYESVEYKNVTTCNGSIEAKNVQGCVVSAIDLTADTAFVDTLTVENLDVDNITVQTRAPEPTLLVVSNMNGIDDLANISGDPLQNFWTLQQVYVQVNGVWSTLLSAPIVSASQAMNTYTGFPAPQNDLIVEYLDFLESAFVSSGIQASHGFRIIGPEFASPGGATDGVEYSIGVSRTAPTIVENHVIWIDRSNGAHSYLLFFDGSVIGDPIGEGQFYRASPPNNPIGLPDDPNFLNPGPGMFIPTSRYFNPVIRRSILVPEFTS